MDKNLPPLFLERLKDITQETQRSYDDLLNALCASRRISIRVNTLLSTKELICQELERLRIKSVTVPWYQNAFILENTSVAGVTELEIYKEGKIYIQSLSSMIPALILAPKLEETVLDVAAAPGSKTSQIAALMENKGEIIANDISQNRIYKLISILKTSGVENVKITNMPGELIWKKYPEYFDKVLVDVPCSMEGRFSCDDDATYEDWSTGKIKKLAKIQKWILRSAVSAAKPGGTIVYSTCTLAPEENEEIIDWLLEKEKGKVVTKDVVIQGFTFDQSLSSWKNTGFSSQVAKTKRIFPQKNMEGFYIAKLKKVSSTL